MMTPVIIQPRETQLEPSSTTSISQLSARKRKNNEDEDSGGTNSGYDCIPSSTAEPPSKNLKTADVTNIGKKQHESAIIKTYSTDATSSVTNKKARETRLEQNRKAARESRRRKKVMIEDLQRSVIFFSRANGTLKHQNDDLTRLLMQAQAQVSVIESTTHTMKSNPASASPTSAKTAVNNQLQQSSQHQQNIAASSENETPTPQSSSNEAKTVAPVTSATPLPPPAATQIYQPVPAMQPGATMQAMASFQQAAAAAMQVAVQGMQGISPGASLTSLAQAAPTAGSISAQQAYNDTMTALAMQQAAIAAAAVPPHLMAQIVGSTCNGDAWAHSATSAVPAPMAPATIISATATTAPAFVATRNTTSTVGATSAPVALMPSSVATATQCEGES